MMQNPTGEDGWALKLLLQRIDAIDSSTAVDLSTFTSADGPATIQELLAMSEPSIEVLRHVKRYLKKQRGGDDRERRRAATALYYATIAKALLAGAEDITGLDRVSLLEGLLWTRDQAWLPMEIRELVLDAQDKLDE